MQAFTIILLGGIASGKSRVSQLFVELGAHTINADTIVHELLAEQAVQDEIRQQLGEALVTSDGVDRKAVAALVFNDKQALETLNSILHPRVLARCREQIAALSRGDERAVVVLDAPLAAETGLTEIADLNIFIETDEQTRIDRAIATRGWTAEELKRREANQWPLEKKRAVSHHVVHNDQSVAKARDDVRRIWDQVIKPQL